MPASGGRCDWGLGADCEPRVNDEFATRAKLDLSPFTTVLIPNRIVLEILQQSTVSGGHSLSTAHNHVSRIGPAQLCRAAKELTLLRLPSLPKRLLTPFFDPERVRAQSFRHYIVRAGG